MEPQEVENATPTSAKSYNATFRTHPFLAGCALLYFTADSYLMYRVFGLPHEIIDVKRQAVVEIFKEKGIIVSADDASITVTDKRERSPTQNVSVTIARKSLAGVLEVGMLEKMTNAAGDATSAVGRAAKNAVRRAKNAGTVVIKAASNAVHTGVVTAAELVASAAGKFKATPATAKSTPATTNAPSLKQVIDQNKADISKVLPPDGRLERARQAVANALQQNSEAHAAARQLDAANKFIRKV
jgi:hypothetical protein